MLVLVITRKEKVENKYEVQKIFRNVRISAIVWVLKNQKKHIFLKRT